jgi:hypothetical protein
MVRYVRTTLVLYPEKLFGQGHLINRWGVQLTAETKAAVKSKAPPRRSRSKYGKRRGTGALQRSIRGTTSRIGATRQVSSVSVNTYYAKWVLGGTAAQGRRFIYSDTGWLYKPMVDAQARLSKKGGRVPEDFIEMGLYMRLPMANVGGSRIFHLRVHGQRSNNFMYDGYNVVAAKHPALKPFRNKYAF